MDAKIHDIARRMIESQFEERKKQLILDINRIKNEMSARDVLHSGMTVRQIHELCYREIEIRAFIVWKTYMRVISAGIDSLEGLGEELKTQVKEYVSTETPELMDQALDIEKRLGMTSIQEIDKAKDHALKKVFAEIDLFALSLQNKAREVAKSKVVANVIQHITNSTIGANQIGAGATANVNLTISTQDRQDLLHALSLIKSSLDSVQSYNGFNKEELTELIVEAETEIKKEKPNRLKFGSIFLAIGTTIQTVGAMQPAYKLLKSALFLCGISLP